MTFLPSPIDVVLLLLWFSVVVLAAQHGFLGLLVGVVGTIFLNPLLRLAEVNPLLGLFCALLIGFLLSVVLRPFPRLSTRQPAYSHVLGALGGALLGGTLVLALAVSLPLGRDFNGAMRYPDPKMPYADALQSSRLVELGRVIVLYPLLQESGEVAPAYRGVLRVLHDVLVVKPPWEEG